MRPVTLTAGRLLLRPPVPADAEAVRRACQDPDIARWTAVPAPYTAADARAWVETEALAGWSTDTHLVWYACDRDAPEVPLVSVGLHHLDLTAREGEIGYWAVPEARGAGLTTAAVRAVCRFGFDELGLERVAWEAAAGNDASRRVAEKVGFRVEATARMRLVLRGRREDAWVGGLLPADLHAQDPDVAPLIVRPTDGGADADAEDPLAGGDGTPRTPPAPSWAPVRGVEITAGSLHLRPWSASDVEVVADLLADPGIALWNPFTRTGSVTEDAARFVGRATDGDATHVGFAVVDATTGEVLGHVALHQLDLDAGHGEVGYWTVPVARGRGVATRAVSAASRWGFGALGLTRLELFHAADNPGSCGVALRAGFAQEGELRSSYTYGDGRRHDEHLHGRLSSDPAA